MSSISPKVVRLETVTANGIYQLPYSRVAPTFVRFVMDEKQGFSRGFVRVTGATVGSDQAKATVIDIETDKRITVDVTLVGYDYYCMTSTRMPTVGNIKPEERAACLNGLIRRRNEHLNALLDEVEATRESIIKLQDAVLTL